MLVHSTRMLQGRLVQECARVGGGRKLAGDFGGAR